MIDPQTQQTLLTIFERESISLMMYIDQAFPWTTSKGVPALDRLQTMIARERELITAIARYLVRNRVPVGNHRLYPMSFTSLNFLSLEHTLERLIASEKAGLAALEPDLAKLTDDHARELVANLQQTKENHVTTLEEMLAPQEQPTSA